MIRYVGPTQIDCAHKCVVPEGVILAAVPTPRHNWGDVKVCPNDDCDGAFLIVQTGEKE